MEMKANERAPMWLISLLGAHECNIIPVSKYCQGIEGGFSFIRNSKIH
jgi:hypothetical protein